MKSVIALLLIITIGLNMPKGIKGGKSNRINMPKWSLTKEGRLPPPSLRFSAPGLDFSNYTYKQLVQIAKERKKKPVDRFIMPIVPVKKKWG